MLTLRSSNKGPNWWTKKYKTNASESEARADALRAMLDPMKDVDWKTLLAASEGGNQLATNDRVGFPRPRRQC